MAEASLAGRVATESFENECRAIDDTENVLVPLISATAAAEMLGR